MIAFEEMLALVARAAGIRVPEDLEHFEQDSYPHWVVYKRMQLGRSMPYPDSHRRNAELIAMINEDYIKKLTAGQILLMGYE